MAASWVSAARAMTRWVRLASARNRFRTAVISLSVRTFGAPVWRAARSARFFTANLAPSRSPFHSGSMESLSSVGAFGGLLLGLRPSSSTCRRAAPVPCRAGPPRTPAFQLPRSSVASGFTPAGFLDSGEFGSGDPRALEADITGIEAADVAGQRFDLLVSTGGRCGDSGRRMSCTSASVSRKGAMSSSSMIDSGIPSGISIRATILRAQDVDVRAAAHDSQVGAARIDDPRVNDGPCRGIPVKGLLLE